MKWKNLRINILILIAIVVLFGCTTQSNNSQANSPENVVEKFFQYRNKKNKSELLTTLTEHWNTPNMHWEFENLDNIKLIEIREDKSKSAIEGYLKYGRGSVNGTTENNLKVFNARYKVKYKKDGISSQDSGTYNWDFFLIRKDENSPWLIDDFGE